MTFLNHKILVAFTLIALTVVSTSCFKDEPLNAECDIEQAWVHVSDLEANFYNANDTLISVLSNEDKVVFTMRDDADVTAFAPQFKITAGATITPESGSVHDFSNGPVTYTVTSQDGKWSRKYFVSCNRMARYSTSVIDFDFEHFELDKDYHKFYVWHNVLPDGSLGDDWATGNYGFYIANSNAPANDYPTFCHKRHRSLGKCFWQTYCSRQPVLRKIQHRFGIDATIKGHRIWYTIHPKASKTLRILSIQS